MFESPTDLMALARSRAEALVSALRLAAIAAPLTLASIAATPPGAGATVAEPALAVLEGDEVERGMRLGSEVPIGAPLAPDGGDTRVPSLAPPPELPLLVPPPPPDDPLDDEPVDVLPPLRGPACAHAVTGTVNASATASDPNVRIDLVIAVSPGRPKQCLSFSLNSASLRPPAARRNHWCC
jgi:hypothetical protein